ncbi:MAG: response regulator transcription factor [bacterium]|nr:response regulator transcription factor [bacterium]
MRILVIEDEQRLADALVQILKEARYEADVSYRGDEGYSMALSGQYDLILLDVMLPGTNGFEVAKGLRRNHVMTPVIMLTAKDDVSDKIHGLDYGADDYMTKPFVPGELLARIRALSRRHGEYTTEELRLGDLTLHLNSNDLSCGEKSIHLAYKEYEMMKLLMSSGRTLLSKEMLITRIWGADSDAEDNNVEAYISFLRKKLAFLGSKTTLVSVRKVGYRLEVPQ